MSELTLSKRLFALAHLIPRSGGVADVGTDHGYLPVWLCQSGHEGKIFATDINPGPLKKAIKTAEEHGFKEDISFIMCDGLKKVNPSDVKTIVIAGMGGETIISILSDALWTAQGGKNLIFQPMTKSEDLRRWLYENKYRILSEQLVKDGKLYEIIMAQGGVDCPYTPAELFTGHTDLITGDYLYKQQLDALILKFSRACDGLAHSSKKEDEIRLGAYRDLLTELRNKRDGIVSQGG